MTARLVVVGAAVIRGRQLLAARRSAPAGLAGRWEFPGGKREPAESDSAALIRECQEELGVQIAVGECLGDAPISAGVVLRVFLANILAGTPEPLQDHDELRWLAAGELEDVDWLPADRPFIPQLRGVLWSSGDQETPGNVSDQR